MLEDRYGNALSTVSAQARDAYVLGLDRFLAAEANVEEPFERAIAEDETFALPYIALARYRQIRGDRVGAQGALAKARAVADRLTAMEAGHLETLGLLIDGKMADGYAAARRQLTEHPRDAMVAQSCLGVFGLIGFSGQPGREAENLAVAEVLAPHYGDDWWYLSILSFAQMEAGQNVPAEKSIERSMALNPRNANGAHYRSHLYYESGETDAGYAYLRDWRRDYDRSGLMHCHLAWHVALWALARGDIETMWQVIDSDIDPRKTSSPPLNVLTDLAAILYRAELAGEAVSPERWRVVSDYASQYFPKPGLAFADVHAALAHAMADNGEALEKIMAEARGPAADMVTLLAEAFRAIASRNWPAACDHLTAAMVDHARIGGSRAQRDLIEYAMASVLLKLGKGDEATRLLAIRRPIAVTPSAVQGLAR